MPSKPIAGHPIEVMHFLQPVQPSASMETDASGLIRLTHGALKITTEGPTCFTARITAETLSSKRCGFACSIHATPRASSAASIESGSDCSPMSVRPMPGWGCPPVMAVVELSRTHTVMSCWLYTAFAMPVKPLAKNVESPTKAIWRTSGSTIPRPCAMVMPAPMHRHVSTASSGAALPSV